MRKEPCDAVPNHPIAERWAQRLHVFLAVVAYLAAVALIIANITTR